MKNVETIVVDFDGTCTTHEYPNIGRDIGAQRVLKRLVEAKVKLVLFTMRDKEELKEAEQWFADNDIPLYGSQRNPAQGWTTSPKAYGQIYIDDAALGCPLIYPTNGERPYVDWNEVEHELENRGVLETNMDEI